MTGVADGPLDARAIDVPPVSPTDVTLVDGRTFAISDAAGNIWGAAHGLVHDDLRHLSQFVLHIEGWTCEVLTDTATSPFSALFLQRVRLDDADEADAALIVRHRWVAEGLREDIEIDNPTGAPIELEIRLTVSADFAHLFDVKAGRNRPPGALLMRGDDWHLVHASDPTTATRLRFVPAPDEVDTVGGTFVWHPRLGPREVQTVCVTAEAVVDGELQEIPFPCGTHPAQAIPLRGTHAWRNAIPGVVSTDQRLTTACDQAFSDLAALRIVDDEHPDRVLVAAGTPWFMTVFGRDSLLTAIMTLPFDAQLPRGVLRTLADLQGRIDDPAADEEPGKILHELRRHGGGGPFATRSRYYGSVDATPLFVMLAADAWRWGGLDPDDVAALGPPVDAALDWLVAFLDAGQFVSYLRRENTGLTNQGWKDSWDGISFAAGALPDAPIALVEVQAYTYAALVGAAELAAPLGLRHQSQDLIRRAESLRERFNEAFWDQRGYFILGIDGRGRPIDALTTNPGHALWTGIAHEDLANQYLDRVMAPDLWTGWGVRTLSDQMSRYHPLSYHNGSVWPHDTAILAAGAARYGRWDVVDTILEGALAATTYFAGRPPELFAGLSRSRVPVPVPYPSSCSPQAWSSASILLLARSVVGLDVSRDSGDLVVRRTSEQGLPDLTFDGLWLAGQRWDIRISDGDIAVHRHRE